MPSESVVPVPATRFALWDCPFRPFFLATAGYAIVVVGYWLGVWFAGWPLPEALAPMHWHSHEMLFGMVAAAIAGFVLTAMCNWTGAAPLAGPGLVALFALWLVGRLAMLLADWMPAWLVAAADLSFLLTVAIYAGRIIWRAGNLRNLPIVGMVAGLWLLNVLFHVGLWTADPVVVNRAELGTVVLIVLLMVVIGGRITPAFTRNWLRRAGRSDLPVRSWKTADTAAIATTAVLLPLVLAGAPMSLIAAVAAVAGLANAWRLIGWAGWLTREDPLMWILHLGYAWIPLGLLLLGLSALWPQLAPGAWLHALAAGAMGVLILGVMTRVCLGHTGRALVLPSSLVPAYWLVLAAAALRVGAALGLLPYAFAVTTSGLAWMAAFAIFVVTYWPILSRPLLDGRPG